MQEINGIELPAWIQIIIASIVTLAGKLGFDKVRKENKRLNINNEDPTVSLDSSITNKDTVFIWLTNQMHKLRNEVNIPINSNSRDIAALELRVTIAEKAIVELGSKMNAEFSKLHQHFDASLDKTERRLEANLSRIWEKLDRS